MYQINYLNPISPKGTALWTEDYQKTDALADADAVMVRSAQMHELELPDKLLAVARAGAGVNNIPLNKCAEAGIVVFNTPGANANGVVELAMCGMLLGSRDVVGGINWVQTIKDEGDVAKKVEKGKCKFAGTEIKGKKLGVIGLGAIGGPLANNAIKLGMEVYGYDPYLSVDAAWKLSRAIKHANTLEEIYAECDYITVHVPLMPATKGMLSKDAFAAMKDGVRILNFSRDGLVDSVAMKDALAAGKVACYVVDFPTADMLGVENVIAIPHLGASTPESEDNCAVMAADQIKDYLENGNIKNSVNYPDVQVPRSGDTRICVLHKNIPNMLAQISAVVSADGVNIEAMTNKSRKDFAYTILDIVGEAKESFTKDILAIEGVIRVRVL